MSKMRPILSKKPAGMLKGEAIIRYNPERNAALVARENSITQEWIDAIGQVRWGSEIPYKSNDQRRRVDNALARIRSAYQDGDVVEAQLGCRDLAYAVDKLNLGADLNSLVQVMKNRRNQYHYWAVADVDLELARYYRWWVDNEIHNITKVDGYGLSGPNKKPHITITRGVNDLAHVPKEERDALWGKYEGQTVEFFYSPDVRPYRGYKADNGIHWAIEVKSTAIDQIRSEFDLKMDFGYHITIGREYY